MDFRIYFTKPMKLPSQMTEAFLERLDFTIQNDREINVSNLAIKAGLGNSVIRLMLKNRSSPTLNTAEKICHALGTDLVTFLSDAKTEEEKEIVRLLAELDVASQRELLGYGRGLRASQDPSHHATDEDE